MRRVIFIDKFLFLGKLFFIVRIYRYEKVFDINMLGFIKMCVLDINMLGFIDINLLVCVRIYRYRY